MYINEFNYKSPVTIDIIFIFEHTTK